MEKNSRWWDLPSAVLLFLAVQASTWRLQTTGWTEGLEHVRNAAVLGLILGLALGQSRFQKRGVFLLSAGYMLIVFIWQWLGFIEFGNEQLNLGEKLLILAGRLFTDLNEFFSGRPVDDQLLIVMLLCIPYWCTGLYSGYQLIRHGNYLGAVLPNGILMLIVSIYHFTLKDYTWMFGVFLFVSLLLMGRVKYLKDRKRWAAQRVQVSSESGLDINNTTMVIAAVLVMVAWSIPYTITSAPQAKETWQEITGDWFSGDFYDNLFSSVEKEKKPQPRNFQTELALGNQAALGELVVFLVYVPSGADEYPRLYWRGQIYDQYENDRWLTSGKSEASYNTTTDGDLEIPDVENRTRMTFTFDVYSEGQTLLYSAAQPIRLNHGAIILHSKLPGEEEEIMDVMALRALPSLEAGDLYRTSALIADPTIPELQEAGEAYPDWVKEKYLQLPADFSPRIRSLAREITADHDNPYDQATAITNYLREEINYRPGITFPEEYSDPLEFFLFDAKQGFCNYYATAEVLMLRSVGIPARLAVGYAQGEPNLQNSVYTVRERDLHAWPEVYFPGYGWIEFEPTGNQEPLERPLQREVLPVATAVQLNPVPQAQLLEEETPLPDGTDEETQPKLTPRQVRWLTGIGGFILLILVATFVKRRFAPNTQMAVILKSAIDRSGFKVPAWVNRWLLWSSLPAIERSFQSINTSLRLLGKPQGVHVTAAERAQLLRRLVPHASNSIETLLQEHHSALFSPREGDTTIARRAARDILYKTLSYRLKTIILGYN